MKLKEALNDLLMLPSESRGDVVQSSSVGQHMEALMSTGKTVIWLL